MMNIKKYETDVLLEVVYLYEYAFSNFEGIAIENVIEVIKENYCDFIKYDDLLIKLAEKKGLHIPKYESLEMFYKPIFEKEFKGYEKNH